MAKTQYTERPYKVTAEAYDAAGPMQPGVCVCTDNPMLWTDGRPHVHTPTGMVTLAAGDWIVEDLWDHSWDVMPDAEFTARFGPGGAPSVEG